MRGLLDRKGLPTGRGKLAIHAFVVQARWADLQPSAGGPIATDNVIDQAIAAARRLNREDPARELKLKLRVYAGIDSPDWAKNLGGEPLAVRNPSNGKSGTVAHFWSEEYGDAYATLQQKLAAMYDSVPEIREVVVSRCTTVFAEPFIRDVGDQSTVEAFLAGGFTTELDDRCHRSQIDAHDVWRQTRSALALNPYKVVSAETVKRPNGKPQVDFEFTNRMMKYCRAKLGARCILENNSIRHPTIENALPMYASMKALGPPLAFQTATPEKVGDLARTLDWAVKQGANAVELPKGYDDDLSLSDLQRYDQRLRENRTK